MGLLSGRAGLDQPGELSLRAWPWDLDTNGHLNNGRYLTFMDFGRLHLAARAGWLLPVLKHRAKPLVALSLLRHFKPVPALAKVNLHSRLVCWDDKWLYFEQRLYFSGELAAAGLIKALIADASGPVPSAVSLSWAGYGNQGSPAMPEAMRQWLQAESGWIAILKKERGDS
jgi:acyl-CoA thioesterase FadM